MLTSGAARALVTGVKFAMEGPPVGRVPSQNMKTSRFSPILLLMDPLGHGLGPLEPRIGPLRLKIDPCRPDMAPKALKLLFSLNFSCEMFQYLKV